MSLFTILAQVGSRNVVSVQGFGCGYGLLFLLGLSSFARDKQLIPPISKMQPRQNMPMPENSGKTKDRLLVYDEMRKLHVSGQTAQDIDVAQHTGKSSNCS